MKRIAIFLVAKPTWTRFLGLWSGTLIAAVAAQAAAQKIGDVVVVTVDYKTRIHDEEVGSIYAGGVHRIIDVNGKWCAVQDVPGWIPRQYVLTLDKALQQYSGRIRENERDVDALATRAMIYLQQGDLRAAFADLNNALKIDGDRPNFWNNRGLVYMRMNQIDKAIGDISYAIRLSPDYANAWHNRGLCYHALSQFDKAIADYNKAIEVQDDVPVFYVNRGVSLHAAGQPDKALADFDKAISLRKDLPEAYIGRSNVMLGRGDLIRAEDNASEAIRLDPKSADARNNRGWIRYKAGDLEKALEDFDKAIAIDDRFSRAWSNRGVLLSESGDLDEAIENFDRAIKYEGSSPLAFSNRGNTWMGKREYEKARADFDKALELAPDDPETLNAKAWFLAICPKDEYRDGARAVELAERACQLSAMKDWSHVDTLAAARAELGEFEEATKLQRTALQLAPPNKKDICQKRLEMYTGNKPFRSDTGK